MSTSTCENERPSKLYEFSVCRNTFTVMAKCREEAIDILASTLTKSQEELDSYSGNNEMFQKFKVFGTTLYQRDDRYLMINEKRMDISDRIDLTLSDEFISEERVRYLISKNIIRVKEIKEGIAFSKKPDDWNDSDDDEKYSTY